jgi:hypothetical protein
LTFHHLDKETKDHKVSKKMASMSKETIRREINKCVILCFNCHTKVELGIIRVGEELLCQV